MTLISHTPRRDRRLADLDDHIDLVLAAWSATDAEAFIAVLDEILADQVWTTVYPDEGSHYALAVRLCRRDTRPSQPETWGPPPRLQTSVAVR